MSGVSRVPLDIPVSGTLQAIFSDLARQGKRALIVGGAVRDALMGAVPKDIDIEVYDPTLPPINPNLPPEQQIALREQQSEQVIGELIQTLRQYGHADLVGRSFGVVKFRDEDGEDYDFSLPRTEVKTGTHHRDFQITPDASLSPQEAAERRDFTMNALAYDPTTSELHDYYGGQKDIESRTLRHTSEKFRDDPLRVLRGMQFAARYGMQLAPETAEMIREMTDSHEADFGQSVYGTLARERVAEEWMKLATKGKRPGAAIQYLIDTGWIKFFPQIAKMVGVPQEYEWHPEGDVHIHTAHVMDAAAEIADREGLKGDDRATLIFSALAHDFAKGDVQRDAHGNPILDENGQEIPITRQLEKGGKLRWTAHGHEPAGGPLARQFLKEIGVKKEIIDRVVPMVARHLEHINYKDNVSPAQVRKLADEIRPANIRDLFYLMEADASGRPPLPKQAPEHARRMLERAQSEGVHEGVPPMLIQGRDVMPYFGNEGGKHIGDVVDAARAAWIKGHYSTPEEASAWLHNHMRPLVGLVKGTDVVPYLPKPGPEVGRVVQEAWEAQNSGAFSDRDSAMAWLQQRMKSSV